MVRLYRHFSWTLDISTIHKVPTKSPGKHPVFGTIKSLLHLTKSHWNYSIEKRPKLSYQFLMSPQVIINSRNVLWHYDKNSLAISARRNVISILPIEYKLKVLVSDLRENIVLSGLYIVRIDIARFRFNISWNFHKTCRSSSHKPSNMFLKNVK